MQWYETRDIRGCCWVVRQHGLLHDTPQAGLHSKVTTNSTVWRLHKSEPRPCRIIARRRAEGQDCPHVHERYCQGFDVTEHFSSVISWQERHPQVGCRLQACVPHSCTGVLTPVIPHMSLLESRLAPSQLSLFLSLLLLLPCSCSLWPTHDAQAAWQLLRSLPLSPRATSLFPVDHGC